MPVATAPVGPFKAPPSTGRKLPPLQKRPGKVRIVKDILRVGTWTWSGGEATFTLQDLQGLVDSFNKQKTDGILRPLQWDHSDPETNHASTEQVIAYLSDLWVDGDTLYAACYVTPAEKDELTGEDWPVSVHVVWNTPDQLRRTWPIQLLHVAIVDQPSMPGQKRFAALSARSPRETADQRFEKAFRQQMAKGGYRPREIDRMTRRIGRR